MPIRETSLRSLHESSGAKMVPFAGWNMPVQYRGILHEVQTVRSAAGLFDLGHMGRVRVRGPEAEAFLQRLQTNDASAIQPGRIRYAMILNDRGTIEDDILVYREEAGADFFVVINAGNADKDLAIMREVAADFDATVTDQTDELGMFAIQGPKSEAIAQRVVDADLSELRYYAWTATAAGGTPVEVSRTGYTGEDGFEVYCPQAETPRLWAAFLEAGQQEGIEPIGLGARDTLRLEAGMALYGHEIHDRLQPLEAGLEWAVKYTHDFRGREALESIKSAGGSGKRLVGLKTTSRRIPREGYGVAAPDGSAIGEICSGAASPTLETNIATAYVTDAHAEPGTEVAFVVRDKHEPATICSLPFYKRPR